MQDKQYNDFLKVSRDKIAKMIVDPKVKALFTNDMNEREVAFKKFNEVCDAHMQFEESQGKEYVEWTEKTPAGQLHMCKLREYDKDCKAYEEYLKQLAEWEQANGQYERFKEYKHLDPEPKPKDPLRPTDEEKLLSIKWMDAKWCHEQYKKLEHPRQKPKEPEIKLPIADFKWSKFNFDCVDPLEKFNIDIPRGTEPLSIEDHRVLLGALHDGFTWHYEGKSQYICPDLCKPDTIVSVLYWGWMMKNPEYQPLIEEAFLYVEAALSGSEAATQQATEKHQPKDDANSTHTPDFRSVTWHGKPYVFKKNQATAIKLLWQAHEDPHKVGVHESEIGKALETISGKYRLIQTFRQRCKGKKGLNPAWKELIEHTGAGVYRLRISKQDNAKSL